MFIASKQFHIRNTVRDTNIVLKMLYERSKGYDMNKCVFTNYLFYPELEL